jgi:hypothetical protein
MANPVLAMGGGNIRLVAFVKYPPADYVATASNGFDEDVTAAVIAAQSLAGSWFQKKQPFRFFIDGYGYTSETDAKDYSSASYRNGCIVVGNIDGSTQKLTVQILGKAAAMQPQQNIGRIKSGSLNIPETSTVYIGETPIDQVDSAVLDTLHDKQYITLERNQIADGYVVTDDPALTSVTDDYNNLRYGRVIDNATRIAFLTYYQQLKDDVDVDEDTGELATIEIKSLENAINTAIDQNMRSQLSLKNDGTADVTTLINPDPTAYAALYAENNIEMPNFNLLQTGSVYIFCLLKPKGCLKYINVFLGYASTAVAPSQNNND